MPDLLTHALVGYVLGTALSWRYRWISPPYVTAVMAGTALPDLSRFELVVPEETVESALGVPFDWWAFHSIGGVAVAVVVGALLATTGHRRRLLALFALGAGSHLFLDALLLKPSGRSYAVFWPLTQYNPPSPGLYQSTDPWPAVVALLLAAAVYLYDRRRRRTDVGYRTEGVAGDRPEGDR